MRTAAIAANLLQMLIVLTIFLIQGISLGGVTVFFLFVLLVIACFNLLVVLFPRDADQGVKGHKSGEKKPLVKRHDLRVSYVSDPRPVLAVGGKKHKILDIAEGGIRIHIGRDEQLKKRFKGHLEMLCGETLNIKVQLIRREGDEAALEFKPPIEYSVLLKERQFVKV